MISEIIPLVIFAPIVILVIIALIKIIQEFRKIG